MKTIIKKDKYEGYVWYSHKNDPEIIQDQEFELVLEDEENPFVIEAQLCNTTSSYSIKYIDGHYFINEYDLTALADVEKTFQPFLPNFTTLKEQKKIKELKFFQYWRPQTDPLCEAMLVLQPAEFVFVGFKYAEE